MTGTELFQRLVAELEARALDHGLNSPLSEDRARATICNEIGAAILAVLQAQPAAGRPTSSTATPPAPNHTITSGTELDWPMVVKAISKMRSIVDGIAFTPPEATVVHVVRCHQIALAMDQIAVALKFTPRRLEAWSTDELQLIKSILRDTTGTEHGYDEAKIVALQYRVSQELQTRGVS